MTTNNKKVVSLTFIASNLYSGSSGSNNSLHKFFKTPRLIVDKTHWVLKRLLSPHNTSASSPDQYIFTTSFPNITLSLIHKC